MSTIDRDSLIYDWNQVPSSAAPVEPEPQLPAWHSKILNGWTKPKP